MFGTFLIWAAMAANSANDKPQIPPKLGIPKGEIPVDVRPIVTPAPQPQSPFRPFSRFR